MDDKVLPNNLEAEQAVLGAMLLDPHLINTVLGILQVSDFYRDSHRKIFESIVDLYDRDETVDLVTVKESLRNRAQLEEIGGAAYLASLIDDLPTTANVELHANIIQNKSSLRHMINAASRILSKGYDNPDNVQDLLYEAEKAIMAVFERKSEGALTHISSVLKPSFRTIEELYEKGEKITGMPSGFADLDDLTTGFQPADLIIIAGRPSMGKTSLVSNMALHVALECGKPVAMFTFEMSKEQMVLRMLCSEAMVSFQNLRSGSLSKSDWPKLTMAAGRLSNAPLYIDDSPVSSPMDLRVKCRLLKREHGLGMIIIDYLQMMKADTHMENRQQEISAISRGLKALAKEMKVPVISAAQLSRAVEVRKDHRPQLADLRESGAIEQDADLVAFIYRPEVYGLEQDETGQDVEGIAEVIISKQRNGPTGTVRLAFLKQFTRFENLERFHKAF